MNNSGAEIIRMTKSAIEKLPELDNLIDKAIEPIKDYTDTLGDLASPVKAFLSIASLRRRIALKAFLTNYANSLSNGYEIDKDEITKLENYFSKSENIQFVSEIIENGIQAKSIKCSSI
ncbi:hypothetical protein AHMF7605_14895 [Adhaeribacter arboris]|uniref:Uncharacterized protein n=1 Tax=Adhaeribacter arboris TaxID=2072846 RepID=A0A2T2YGS5_9BACT|nr:hypothetical protein [Adhaeribacter arboris]PSR54703.1 hypothetical protein AHMF7605_14895 [Adhaeribacter arboris]